MKTSELTGAALDWAVAKCAGWIKGDVTHPKFCRLWRDQIRTPAIYPSTDWAQGGTLIDSMVREGLRLTGYKSLPTDPTSCQAQIGNIVTGGPTPLIAAMRCFCASRLGDEINIPEELL